MSDTAANLPPRSPLLGVSPSQMGDLKAHDVTGGDKTESNTYYQGFPIDQVMDLLGRFLDKEPQRAELREAARVMSHRATDQRLDQIALILNRVTLALVVQAVVLTLLLFTTIGMLLLESAGPRLAALAGL